MTALEIQHIARKGNKIAMITAYDYPSARQVESAGFQIVLVGDSLGMVVLGYDTTLPVTMEDMLHHCKAVRRGAPSRFIVGDLPFGSYEDGPSVALKNALRLVKEAGVDAVKIEGGRNRVDIVRKLVQSGIAVMGHVGLTPQGIGVLGGFRAQGRTAVKAKQIVEDALALQEAGAFSIVVECVPSPVGKAVTEALQIPVIGIGAGPHTSGQVLVYHDMLGLMHHPHHEKHVPSFCKRYAAVGSDMHNALLAYKHEVHASDFPTEAFNPYKMSAKEEEAFSKMLSEDAENRKAKSVEIKKKLVDADEYEVVKLY